MLSEKSPPIVGRFGPMLREFNLERGWEAGCWRQVQLSNNIILHSVDNTCSNCNYKPGLAQNTLRVLLQDMCWLSRGLLWHTSPRRCAPYLYTSLPTDDYDDDAYLLSICVPWLPWLASCLRIVAPVGGEMSLLQ